MRECTNESEIRLCKSVMILMEKLQMKRGAPSPFLATDPYWPWAPVITTMEIKWSKLGPHSNFRTFRKCVDAYW